MINLKLVSKKPQATDTIHIQLKNTTVSRLIDEIRQTNWSYENKTTVIEFEESKKYMVATGQSTVGAESYIEIINMAKAILNMLNKNFVSDDVAKDLLEEYYENGCGTIPYNGTTFDHITVWADKISEKNAVIIFNIGNLIVPFSYNDYLFSPSSRNKMMNFKKTIDQYEIPYVFGSVYISKQHLEKDTKHMTEICKQIPTVEEKINSIPIILDWNKENKDLIILLGLKEKYRQQATSLKYTISHIKAEIKNI